MQTYLEIYSMRFFVKRTLLIGTLLILLVLLAAFVNRGDVAAGLGFVQPAWTRDLPSDLCLGTNHTDCHIGSPVIAFIDGDSKKDIVAVTNKGHVVAYKHDGSLLWDRDVAPYFGMAPNTHEIHSSPAVADIDDDGYPEIVVGTGTLDPSVCTQGGLIVLNHNGGVEPGWPFLAFDEDIAPAGCRDTIVSSPALGDLDNDGDLEIVAAGFDKRLYAWHHNGTLVNGFPPDSAHRQRFPDWEGFKGHLGDNTWSSPALADLNGDGYDDIILGTGEGNYDATWGGDAGGWSCPYQLPPYLPKGYCGGSIYAVDRNGSNLPGFPVYLHEAIGSSPAFADFNGDGKYEFFIGASDYYHSLSPDHPTYGFRLYGFDNQGKELPGWTGGKATQGIVIQSPSIGDIAGDYEPEIVVLAADNRLYAWHLNGSPVSGFPMSPLDFLGGKSAPFNWIRGLSLADYDGDGKMEIIFAQGWAVNVVDGDGKQLTAANYPNNTLPAFNASGMIANSPAIDDIDNDGRLELVVSSSKLTLWNLDQSSDLVAWPQFKGNSQRTAVLGQPSLDVSTSTIYFIFNSSDFTNSSEKFEVKNSGAGSFDWQSSVPPDIVASPSTGTAHEGKLTQVTVTATSNGKKDGAYYLGNIVIDATMDGGVVKNSRHEITVRMIVGDFQKTFTPLIIGK